MLVAGLVVAACGFTSPAADPTGRYAIVVKKDVAAGPWGKVVQYLETKHQGKTFAYEKTPDDVRKAVGAYHPRWVCFVCLPTENFPAFAPLANKFCRTLDDDPYVDAIWGILTGYDPDHAIGLAKSEPVVINRAFTKTQGDWLNWVTEGDYVTEWSKNKGELGKKTAGKEVSLSKAGGPVSDPDDAKFIHKLLTEDKFDLIIGSGHGGHGDWMLMYPRGQGFLRAKDGQLAMKAPGVDLPLSASRPKVYWAVGNCLTGVVNDNRHSFKDSYALAWMKNGAKQYIGAVQSTWYELNWSMADWFLKQEGRWSFSESLFLLRQYSQYLLAENLVAGRDRQGTEFTDGIFVLYGDPALDARVKKTCDPALDESLDVKETTDPGVVRMTYKVKVNFVGTGNKRTAEKYDGWCQRALKCRQ
jgi:hypothetical protein